MSTPVLRLARTGDEGPRRLRAQGHLARSQPRRPRMHRRRRHRRRQPVAHAAEDQRDLRPHRVRGGRHVQRVPDPAHRRRAPRRPQGLLVLARGREREGARQRVRADAAPGLHARDEAVRGRAARRRSRPHRRRRRRDVPRALRRRRDGRAALLGARRPAEAITEALQSQYTDGLDLGAAVQLGAKVLGTDGRAARRRAARGRAARPQSPAPRVPPHQERRARRNPRER